MFSGLLNLPWWGDLIAGLVLVQITIAAVTLYLHRCQAHRALELHPSVSHFFRFWLWLTTGMITKEWAAIHRKHHAKCETEEDPHSPRTYGINRVLWGGVLLYVKESHKTETMQRYGHSTPDDWLERNVYTPFNKWGIVVLAIADVALFGLLPGAIIYALQLAWSTARNRGDFPVAKTLTTPSCEVTDTRLRVASATYSSALTGSTAIACPPESTSNVRAMRAGGSCASAPVIHRAATATSQRDEPGMERPFIGNASRVWRTPAA